MNKNKIGEKMKTCWCILAGTKACETCNNGTMISKSEYFPTFQRKTWTETHNMDRKKIGTGFEIPDIGVFEVIFAESPNFKELSDEKKKIIIEKMKDAAERLMLFINEDIWLK